ncbi:MAG: DUF1295 domain-containing protein [Pseudomonadales bacterium]|nr:DUF1295 domain-containing protein [Pseudomonadales bacterium]
MAIIINIFIIWFYMTTWYFISLYKKRNDIVDVAWGLGFILITFLNLIFNPNIKLLISLCLITIWGIRLATHIYQRNKNKKEDPRYKKLRKNSYLKVFLIQGIFMWLISLPITNSIGVLSWFNLIGIAIWSLGFYFESRADNELKTFINNKNNRGKILQTGLWALSRHPNYFGEVTIWWGIWFLNFNSNWWTIIGPLTITFLILKVSGIPLIEKRYEGNKEYEKYKKRVPVFIPKWPKGAK